ncbi:unnamed protein product [Phytomonas sp. EM1]|nr:unnamed protein product [Phytomonas sp. EM1]|eukprot:CCW65165.1 unnamed protein product [Phytomonas sp. isolate EM1]
MSAGSSAGNPAKRDDSSLTNTSTVLLYPFKPMSLGWWESFLSTVAPLNRVSVLVHVMRCMMTHAVLHEDPFLEEAIIHMGKGLPHAWPPPSGQEDSNYIPAFEAGYHIFQTICVISKFRTLDRQAKHGLLSMAEQRIQAIAKGTQHQEDKMSFWAAAQVASDRIQALQRELDSRIAWNKLMHAMKVLFFSVNMRNGKLPSLDPEANPLDNFACYEGCPCYGKLRNTYTLFVRGMEKIKIIDCAMIASVKDEDVLLREVATELLYRYRDHILDNPPSNDVVRQIQNGTFFYCRVALFRALSYLQDLSELHSDSVTAAKEFTCYLHRFILSMHWVKNEIRRLRGVKDLVPMLNRAITTADNAFRWVNESGFKQVLHTLKGYTNACFVTLAASKYHFAVHSRDIFVGRSEDMRCTNPGCPRTARDLLRCSGCDVTYYCSADCQKVDWEKHKGFCHEIESRRGKPEPVDHVVSEMHCIKPKV